MRFEDRSCVINTVLRDENGESSLLSWAYSDNAAELEIIGFAVCYLSRMSDSDREACASLLRAASDAELERLIASSGQLKSPGPEPDAIVNFIGKASADRGFRMMNGYYRAPCAFEVWSIFRDSAAKELVVFQHADDNNRVVRSVTLSYTIKDVTLKEEEKTGFLGLGPRIPAVRGVEILLRTLHDADRYFSGAVSYQVKGARFSFPIAGTALGKPLKIKDLRKEEVRLTVEDPCCGLYVLRESH